MIRLLVARLPRLMVAIGLLWCILLVSNGTLAGPADANLVEWKLEYWEWQTTSADVPKDGKPIRELPTGYKLLVAIRLYRSERTESVAITELDNMTVRAGVGPGEPDPKLGPFTIIHFSVMHKTGVGSMTLHQVANKDI